MQLMDEALELLLEKKECMTTLLAGPAERRKAVEELDVLLQEKVQHLQKISAFEARGVLQTRRE